MVGRSIFFILIITAACSIENVELKPIPISFDSKLHEDKADSFLHKIETHVMEKFAIFYGDPISFSSHSGELCYQERESCISSLLANFSFVILGAGLEEENHHAHLLTQNVIQSSNKTMYYGYLDLGRTKNFSISELLAHIEKWKEMGVAGILLDEAGFEYWDGGKKNFRIRLNIVLDYLHKLHLKSIINAWDPKDVFTELPENPVHWTSDDGYLIEGYLFSTNVFSFDSYREKIELSLDAKQKYKMKLYGTTTSDLSLSHKMTEEKWKFLLMSAHFDQLDGVAWADDSFSSYDSKLTIPGDDFIKVILDQSESLFVSREEKKTARKIYFVNPDMNLIRWHIVTIDYEAKMVF